MQRQLFTLLTLLLMHSALFINHAFAATIQLPATGQTTSYVAGDDGSLKKGLALPNPRFTDLNDGTVIDNLTDFVWLKNANCFDLQLWTSAIASVNELASGACGLSDGSTAGQWRLPNVEQLESLVDLSRSSPALPTDHPFTAVQASHYWSSSTEAQDTSKAWYVHMFSGYMDGYDKTFSKHVWPVRSGQFWPLDSLIIHGSTGFTSVSVGAVSNAKNMTLYNSGSSPLAITSNSVTGANATEFRIATGGVTPCASLTPTLAAGEKCTLNLTFTPTLKGAKTANLTVAANGKSVSIPLTGTAISTIMGTVTDLSSSKPFAGVTVTITGGNTTQTDSSGNFIFIPPLVYGTYDVTFSKTGYQTITKLNVTVSDQTAKLDIALPISLSGIAKDFGTGIPISGVTVSGGGVSTQTDSNGYYALGSLVPGTYSIIFSKTGYQTITKPDVIVIAEQGTKQNVSLMSFPDTPTSVSALAGNTQATVSFNAPMNTGGSAITGYTVISNPGNITVTGTSSPITVTGLTNGTAYTFTVKATNAAGTGVVSAASNSVTPRTVPGAPTIGPAIAGNIQSTASVSFTAPTSNGGSPITGYTVASLLGNITATGTTSPITVPGLTIGIPYTFTVKATNVVGSGADSGVSGIVVPLPRFVDVGNGTVIDIVSSMTWLKNANCYGRQNGGDYYPWGYWTNSTAGLSASSLVSGQCGLTDNSKAGDWHLPTNSELRIFVDEGYRYDTLNNAAGFFNVQADYYNSQDPHNDSFGQHGNWIVNMANGSVTDSSIGGFGFVWPVRTGQWWLLDTLNITNAQYSFQNQNLGSVSSPREITIANIGQSAITVTSTSITGPCTSDFSVIIGGSNPCNSLTPTISAGESCTMEIFFAPTSSIGIKSANLSMAANGRTINIPISGTAVRTISGLVYDRSTGNNLAGATVTITGGSISTTDTSGNFIFIPPPISGTYTVTISKAGYGSATVTGQTFSSSNSLILSVGITPSGVLNFTSESFPAASTGTLYNQQIKITGGSWPYTPTKAYGTLPPGLAIDPSIGIISGIPTTTGSYTFSIGVTDKLGTYTEKEFTIEVATPLMITTMALPRISKTIPYNFSIQAIGGTAPYSFQLTEGYLVTKGYLPHAITLNPNGTISGSTADYSENCGCETIGWICIPPGGLDCAIGCVKHFICDYPVGGDYSIKVQVSDASGRTNYQVFTLSVDNPLAHTTARLNDAITGTAYTQTLTAAGGYGAYTWGIYAGSLPNGLRLNQATGVISGIPTSATLQPIVLSLSDAAGSVVYKQFTLNALNPLQIQTTTMPNAHVGTAYSELIRISGGIGPYTFSYTGLVPNGLTLNSEPGVIAGTPLSAGYVNLGMTVTDSSWPTPQSVTQALGFRTTSQLTITNSSILPTARQSAVMNPVTLTAAGGSSPYTWSIVDGSLPTGLTFNTATGTISGTPTGKGDFIFSIRVTDAIGTATGGSAANPDKQFFIHVSAPLAVTTNLLPAAGVGIPFVAELQADGGQRLYSWSVATGTLPAGLTLSTEGVVSGTPTAKITSAVTFKVTDSDNPAQSAQKVLTFKVFDTLTIQETSLPQARAQQAYTTSLHAWLGVTPYSWRVSSGNLPPGLALTQIAGIATLQGTPTTAGTYTFTIEATDSGSPQQVATTEFTITVLPVFAITTPANLKSAVRTVAYSASIAASGGAPPYSFAILTGNLPDGLSLNPATGAISGITTDPAGQSSSFTVRVTDSGAPAAYLDKEFSIFAIDQLTITTATLPVVVQQSPYSATLTATGGVSPYTWSVASGALPAGVTLDPASGTLSGTPSACGSFSFTAQVADSTTLPTTVQKPLAIDITCMNGACGASNTKSFSAAPTSNFCTAGTPSALSGAGPWTWSCQGINGGTSASCSANLLKIAGDGNGDGVVTIAEVQSAINMFLGLNNVAGYVDTSGDNTVSIAEVQKVINGFLGL